MNTRDLLEVSPVIAAIKEERSLEPALATDCALIFIMFGNVCNIAEIVKRVKASGKLAIVHLDLIAGLSTKEISVDFIKNNTEADGIISTKPVLVKHAMEIGLYGVFRSFIIDSIALSNTKKQLDVFKPDFIEVMPGIMPRVLKEMRAYTDIPIITGGLLWYKQDLFAAFDAGADAVSTTNPELWLM